ncbi:MAG: cytochrome c biogenesis protein ResB, partial [Candidatus Anammoxibacter sp.]
MDSKLKTNKTTEVKQKDKKRKGFRLWKFFYSVKLAVVVIFLIAVSCILGTFIVQGRNTEEYVARFGKGWAAFLEGAQFTDVFHSHWFTILLVFLCINLFACAVKRWRNTVLQIGFLSTHLSLILIMVGSVIDSKYGYKGAINLIEGQSVDYFFTFDDMKKIPLGFELLLEDFELIKHPPKFELIAYTKENDKERRITIKVGKEQSIASSPYKVEIKRFIPDAELLREPINTSDELKNPAVFVQLYSAENVDSEGWLLANHRNSYEFKREGIRIEYIWAKTEKEFANLDNSKEEKTVVEKKEKSKLIVKLKDRNITVEFPVKVGQHFEVANSEYHVQIVEYTPDFPNKDLPESQQTDDNPAIKIEIHGPQGNEERWIFANYPAWDEMHETKYSDINLVFASEGNVRQIRHVVQVAQDSKGNHKLIYSKEGKIIKNIPWKLDEKYSIGNTGFHVKLVKYYPSFGMKEEIVQKSDNLVNPAILVDTTGPSGKTSEWLFAKNGRAWWYLDDNLALLYQEGREIIKDFKSTLKIIEDGKVVKTKTIEVNDPLSYKGIDFYQANYDPNNPKFSGIQVTSHPGIFVVYTGFWTLCFGIVFIFYIKPFIKRSKSKKRKEA